MTPLSVALELLSMICIIFVKYGKGNSRDTAGVATPKDECILWITFNQHIIDSLSWNSNFRTHIKDRYLENFILNCFQVNATRPPDNWSALVRVMAWCRQAASHYLNQWRSSSVTPCGVDWPQTLFYQTLYTIMKPCMKALTFNIHVAQKAFLKESI